MSHILLLTSVPTTTLKIRTSCVLVLKVKEVLREGSDYRGGNGSVGEWCSLENGSL